MGMVKTLKRFAFDGMRLAVRLAPKGKTFLINTSLFLFGRMYEGPITVQGMKFWIDGVHPLNRSLFFLGEYEPESTECVRRHVRPGMTTLDIGSNFGWYSIVMGHLVGPRGRVYAFDISPDLMASLEKSVRLNGLENVVYLTRAAVGAHPGEIEFYNDFAGGTANLSPALLGKVSKSSVPVIAMDAFVKEKNIQRIDFIKCDIDGAEGQFIAGAHHLLSRKPPVLIEIFDAAQRQFGSTGRELKQALVSFGYRVTSLDESRLTTDEDIETHSSLNVLCS